MINYVLDCVSEQLYRYVQDNILIHYNNIDEAHDKQHVSNVIERSLVMGKKYELNSNILLVGAAYHDLGLLMGRKNHEKCSAALFRKDEFMQKWFSSKEIALIAEAIEDHRAISNNCPRSIYGKILHDVDTFGGNLSELVYRSIRYGKKYFSDYDRRQHFERVFDYLKKKYGEEGYASLYIDYLPHQRNLEEIRMTVSSRFEMQALFDIYYTE